MAICDLKLGNYLAILSYLDENCSDQFLLSVYKIKKLLSGLTGDKGLGNYKFKEQDLLDNC